VGLITSKHSRVRMEILPPTGTVAIVLHL